MALETQASQTAENVTFKLPVIIDQAAKEQAKEEKIHYTEYCAHWLRAAVFGANDGLVSTASLMMGVSAVKTDTKAMILYGFAGFIAGACCMALGEFVSVYSQFEAEEARMKIRAKGEELNQSNGPKAVLLSAMQAAVASALAFSVGAGVPLLAAAFISNNQVRLGVVASATLALLVFSGVGAKLRKAPMAKSCVRVLLGDWLAMFVTFGIMKLFGSFGL